MKIKKLVASTAMLGIAAASLTALTSCGSDNTHKIIFYTTAGDDPMVVFNEAKRIYEKENPGWIVEIKNGYNYDSLKTAVTSTLTANTQPSMAYCYPDHVAQYLKTGKVVNIKELIDDPEIGYTADEWSDFIPSYMAEGESYGVEGTYSLPLARSSEVLYYNKDVFDENNIELPKTWDELWTVCAKLKQLYPKSTPLGYDSEANWMITYLEQQGKADNTKYYTDGSLTGSNRILFNNDKTKTFIQKICENYSKGYFTTQELLGSYTSSLFTKYNPNAADFNPATYTGSFMSIGSTGGALKQTSKNFNAAIAQIPGITEDNRVSISQGPSICLFREKGDESGEKLKATWKFVKLLLTTDIQAKFSQQTGYNPVKRSTYTYPAFVDALEDDTLVNEVIKQVQNFELFTSDAFNGSSTARDQIGEALVGSLRACAINVVASASTINSKIEDAEYEAKYYSR